MNSDNIAIKVADNKFEREMAFALVGDAYSESGLTSDGPGPRIISHHLTDASYVIIAKSNVVLSTITLIRDSNHGIPSDITFAPEVNDARTWYGSIAEASCLASAADMLGQKQQFGLLIRMFGFMIQFAKHREINAILLSTHPRHSKVYQRLFGCKPISNIKTCSIVANNPAILCVHDLHNNNYPLYNKLHEYAPGHADITNNSMTEFEKQYFGRYVV